jgi:hypothetical protein
MALALPFLLTLSLGGTVTAYVALFAAFAFMGIYNAIGKQFALPPVTDLVQGLAWGSLAIYAAELAGGHTTPMTWLVGAYGAGFMFLINGAHGGLRDLTNDLRHRQMTTAIYFEAQPDGRGGAVASRGIRRFGFLAHLALMAVLLMVAFHVGAGENHWIDWGTIALTAAAAAGSFVINHQVMAERNKRRDLFVSLHLLIALVPLVFAAMPGLSQLMRCMVLITFFGPVAFTQPGVYVRQSFRRQPEPPLSRRGDGGDDDDDGRRLAV